LNESEDQTLIETAKAARLRSVAPFSNFLVGAALQTKAGKVFTGCNVENASYGLSNCAERTALYSAIAAGYRSGDFTHLVVIGDTDGPITPCGACRQVMMELGGAQLIVVQTNLHGAVTRTTAGMLLPDAFALDPAG